MLTLLSFDALPEASGASSSTNVAWSYLLSAELYMISTHLSGFWNIFRKCAIHSIPPPVSPHPGHPWEGGKSRQMTCAPTYLPGQPLSNRSDVPSPSHGHLPSPIPNRHMPQYLGHVGQTDPGPFSLPEPMAQLILDTCQSRITSIKACTTIPGNLTSHNKC